MYINQLGDELLSQVKTQSGPSKVGSTTFVYKPYCTHTSVLQQVELDHERHQAQPESQEAELESYHVELQGQ